VTAQDLMAAQPKLAELKSSLTPTAPVLTGRAGRVASVESRVSVTSKPLLRRATVLPSAAMLVGAAALAATNDPAVAALRRELVSLLVEAECDLAQLDGRLSSLPDATDTDRQPQA
jgi:hypothetical protein